MLARRGGLVVKLWYVLAAGLLAGCSGGLSRTVAGSQDEIRARVEGNSEQLYLADQVVGATHWSEPQADGLIWHFALNNVDYAQYRIVLDQRSDGTRVTARFAEVGQSAEPAIPYLRDSARIVSEQVLLAGLEQRPLDLAAVKRGLIANSAHNPLGIVGVQQQYWQEAANITQSNGSEF